jgi:hypothetical protein
VLNLEERVKEERAKFVENLSEPGSYGYETIRPTKLAFLSTVDGLEYEEKIKIMDAAAKLLVEAYLLGIEYASDRILEAVEEEESAKR